MVFRARKTFQRWSVWLTFTVYLGIFLSVSVNFVVSPRQYFWLWRSWNFLFIFLKRYILSCLVNVINWHCKLHILKLLALVTIYSLLTALIYVLYRTTIWLFRIKTWLSPFPILSRLLLGTTSLIAVLRSSWWNFLSVKKTSILYVLLVNPGIPELLGGTYLLWLFLVN